MDIRYRVASVTRPNYTYFDYFNEAYNFACAEALNGNETVYIDRIEVTRTWSVDIYGEAVTLQKEDK